MTHALTYDTLPAHSELRREYVDGVLRITAGPQEPGPLVRRAALLRSAVPAGLWSALALVICVAIFGMMYQTSRRGMSTGLSAVLALAFLIFCASLFALVWRAQCGIRLDAAHEALKQTTLLAASKGRLRVETSGPLGAASYDLSIGAGKAGIVSISQGPADPRGLIDCLQLHLCDGTEIHLLPGRDQPELRWVARALSDVTGLAAASNPSSHEDPPRS